MHDFATAPAPMAPDETRMRFSGAPAESRNLLIRGAALTLATFGFYRFWLITDLRRCVWANTRPGEDGFEYTGSARELLVGFLVALAALAPVSVVSFHIGIGPERLKASAILPLGLLLAVLGQRAAPRSRAQPA